MILISALFLNGIGHQQVIQPSELTCLHHPVKGFSPGPHPKNPPTGASTRFLPSKLILITTERMACPMSSAFSFTERDVIAPAPWI